MIKFSNFVCTSPPARGWRCVHNFLFYLTASTIYFFTSSGNLSDQKPAPDEHVGPNRRHFRRLLRLRSIFEFPQYILKNLLEYFW